MRADRLVLEDFRNYHHEAVEFSPTLNLVVGRNAQGKTNLLEAVYFLGGLGSPRVSDTGLVREGADRALLHADITRGTRAIHVDLEVRPGKGLRTLINKTSATGSRALRELVVGVFFGPDDPALIKGPPEGRRRFVDDAVVKLRPARDSTRREWDRVLRQRNALLKSAPRGGEANRSARSTLDVWDESLVRTGANLTAARLEVLGQLLPYARKRYEQIAGGGELELAYTSTWLDAEFCAASIASPGAIDEGSIRRALEEGIDQVRVREIERGISLVGPQRDDVAVLLASGSGDGSVLDARTYASQGDQRTCALALKLAEYDLLTDVLDEHPVLLLDDVLSELDPARRTWLLDSVRGAGQTIVASADAAEALFRQGISGAHVIEVRAGKVSVRGEQ
jgi:DNA replication and repair protein RecF